VTEKKFANNMSSFKKITLLGGSGFVGSQLTIDLARHCDNVTVLTRRKQRFRDLKVLSNVHVQNCDVHDAEELKSALEGSEVVINLVGILNQSKGSEDNTFTAAHAELTQKVVTAVKETGVSHYLHMSSLGADAEDGGSEYLRSKGEAERHVQQMLGSADAEQQSACAATIFRPSVIFGESDSFFNRFAGLLRIMHVFPLDCCASCMCFHLPARTHVCHRSMWKMSATLWLQPLVYSPMRQVVILSCMQTIRAMDCERWNYVAPKTTACVNWCSSQQTLWVLNAK